MGILTWYSLFILHLQVSSKMDSTSSAQMLHKIHSKVKNTLETFKDAREYIDVTRARDFFRVKEFLKIGKGELEECSQAMQSLRTDLENSQVDLGERKAHLEEVYKTLDDAINELKKYPIEALGSIALKEEYESGPQTPIE